MSDDKFPHRIGKPNGNNFRIFKKPDGKANSFWVTKVQSGGVNPTPQPPFFTFTTEDSGSSNYSIVSNNPGTAIWYMGDGTIYANTDSVSHTYADATGKTVSVAVVDFADVTNVNGIIQASNGNNIGVDASNLPNIPATFAPRNNKWETIQMPNHITVLDLDNCPYPTDATCVVTGGGTITDINIASNQGGAGEPTFDISALTFTTRIDTNNLGNRIILPASNSAAFTLFRLQDHRDQGNLDLSGFTGSISDLRIGNPNSGGLRNMELFTAPNIDDATFIGFYSNYELNGTIVLDNNAGECTSFYLYRNNASNPSFNSIFDLQNFNFSGIFRAYVAANGALIPCRNIIFPAANSNNFTYFQVSSIPDLTSLDLSAIFTGAFSGNFSLNFLTLTTLSLPGNISNVTSFILSRVAYTGTIDIDTDGGVCSYFLVDECGQATIDARDHQGNTTFLVDGGASGGSKSCISLMPPTADSGNYSNWKLDNPSNQGDLDLSGLSGVFTGDFIISRADSLGVLTLPTGDMTGLDLFAITDVDTFNAALNLGTDIIAVDIELQANVISGANIDTMIASINTNVASFPSGAKSVNFGRNGVNSNGVPSAGSITTMTNLASSDDFTFTYWDGTQDQTIN